MVSCNYHGIGLSISMCYLFLIMIAPTYALSDTVFICVLILVSWYLPGKLPYAENYDLFKHFLLRVSIIIGFIVLHSIFLRQAADKRHIREMSNAFVKLAYNDIMTGTLSKEALKTYCAFVTEKQDPERVSAIIYDIDDFKSYNDHYSHMKGDQVLLRVSESVLRVLAQSDQYLFRFGGEEFAVVLPNATEDEARRVACQLLEAVRAAAIPRTDLPDRSIVTASFGVACGTKDELRDLSLAVKADEQLYLCKRGGKNCVAARRHAVSRTQGGFSMQSIDITHLSGKYAVRRLMPEDVDTVCALCRRNTQYYQYCGSGRVATTEDIRQDMQVTPPHTAPEQKYYIGFFDGASLIAIMDLIRGYPDDDTAFIGFLHAGHRPTGPRRGQRPHRRGAGLPANAGLHALYAGHRQGQPPVQPLLAEKRLPDHPGGPAGAGRHAGGGEMPDGRGRNELGD